VPRDQLEGATTLALELGYGAGKPFDIDVDAAVHLHVSTLRKPPCYALETHWSLTEPRERQALDPHGLWTRAQPFAIAGAPALVLSDEDLLLHLCVHASYQHRFEFGLRSICDLAEVIAAQGGRIQWDVVAERMDQAGWGPGVSLTLRLAHTLLGVPIPAAWRAADPRPDLVGAAAALLVGAAPPVARGLSALHDHATPAARLRHLKAMVFAPREDLRRHYPHVGLAWWRWWRVYLLRARDLLLKHSGTAVRLWGRRPSPLRTAVERQQAIRMFLAGEW
jgi:hypothetical protein